MGGKREQEPSPGLTTTTTTDERLGLRAGQWATALGGRLAAQIASECASLASLSRSSRRRPSTTSLRFHSAMLGAPPSSRSPRPLPPRQARSPVSAAARSSVHAPQISARPALRLAPCRGLDSSAAGAPAGSPAAAHSLLPSPLYSAATLPERWSSYPPRPDLARHRIAGQLSRSSDVTDSRFAAVRCAPRLDRLDLARWPSDEPIGQGRGRRRARAFSQRYRVGTPQIPARCRASSMIALPQHAQRQVQALLGPGRRQRSRGARARLVSLAPLSSSGTLSRAKSRPTHSHDGLPAHGRLEQGGAKERCVDSEPARLVRRARAQEHSSARRRAGVQSSRCDA